MRHLKRTAKLGRTSEHRNAMLANLVCSLIEHKRVTTTLAKAKAARSVIAVSGETRPVQGMDCRGAPAPNRSVRLHTDAALTPLVGVLEAVGPISAMLLPAAGARGSAPSFFSSTLPCSAPARVMCAWACRSMGTILTG